MTPCYKWLSRALYSKFKVAKKSAASDSVSLHQKTGSFLLAYRNSPHSTTYESQTKLFLGRRIRPRLDLVKPNVKNPIQKKRHYSFTDSKRSQFNVGDNVIVRDYSEKRKSAQISEKSGSLPYTVETGERRETGVVAQTKRYRHRLIRNPQNRFWTYPRTPVPKR